MNIPTSTYVKICRLRTAGEKVLISMLGVFLGSWIGHGLAWAEEQALLAQFHPYRQGAPRIPQLEPGVTLSRANTQLAKGVLPPAVLNLLAEGTFEITVQETTDLPLRPAYLEATRAYSQGVALTDGGTLHNYRAGAPFPVLDPTDPQAGEKLAWNLRYRDMGETFHMMVTLRSVNASRGVEHTNRGVMRARFGMHRPTVDDNVPEWEAQGVYMKNVFELLAPSDQEGRLRILTVYNDDERTTEQLAYSPQNRRTRKAHMNYITPIGGYYEALQEETPPFFFQGYLHEYDWQFGGAQVMLVPGFPKTTELQFGGQNGWYPQVPWELRAVLLLECTPRHAHPLGKRVFVLDQQTYIPLMVLTSDAAGTFVRLTITVHAHPDSHPGSSGLGLPVVIGGAWINYAKTRATLFTADASAYNRPFAVQRFGLMEILRKGK